MVVGGLRSHKARRCADRDALKWRMRLCCGVEVTQKDIALHGCKESWHELRTLMTEPGDCYPCVHGKGDNDPSREMPRNLYEFALYGIVPRSSNKGGAEWDVQTRRQLWGGIWIARIPSCLRGGHERGRS